MLVMTKLVVLALKKECRSALIKIEVNNKILKGNKESRNLLGNGWSFV